MSFENVMDTFTLKIEKTWFEKELNFILLNKTELVFLVKAHFCLRKKAEVSKNRISPFHFFKFQMSKNSYKTPLKRKIYYYFCIFKPIASCHWLSQDWSWQFRKRKKKKNSSCAFIVTLPNTTKFVSFSALKSVPVVRALDCKLKRLRFYTHVLLRRKSAKQIAVAYSYQRVTSAIRLSTCFSSLVKFFFFFSFTFKLLIYPRRG